MASRLYQDFKIQTPSGMATCNAECYSDHQGHGVFAVYGETPQDQQWLAVHRTQTVKKLKESYEADTGHNIRKLDVWVDKGGQNLEGTRIEMNSEHEVTRAVADPQDYRSPIEATKLGRQLHEVDYNHQMDLSRHYVPRQEPDR
jgi:hypothetical protein